MSVFIKVLSGEVAESKEAVREINSKLLLISNENKKATENINDYHKKLIYSKNRIKEIKELVHGMKNFLPEVPETIIPKSKLEKESKNPHKELQRLRELIEKI